MITNWLEGKPFPLYGDGAQVRDWLYVEDHVRALELVLKQGKPGEIYNVGGGPQNSLSVWVELEPYIDRLFHRKISVDYAPWRAGDQRIYISDIRRCALDLGWRPKTNLLDGLAKLHAWVQELLASASS